MSVFRFLWLSMAVLISGEVSAQTFEEYRSKKNQEYANFRHDKQAEWEAYRGEVNRQYVAYLSCAWRPTRLTPAVQSPTKRKPVRPVWDSTLNQLTSDRLPKGNMIKPQPQPIPQPLVPKTEAKKVPTKSGFKFDFYGTTCYVAALAEHRFRLASTDEKSVSQQWMRLSKERFTPLVSSFVNLREKLQLCDWAYYMLTQKFTDAFFTKEERNEACLMQMYLLVQSGYRARLAEDGQHLYLLLPMREMLYETPYFDMDGLRYYVMCHGQRPQPTMRVFDAQFKREVIFSATISPLPHLTYQGLAPRMYTSKAYPLMSARVGVNRHLMEFYAEVPAMEHPCYVASSLSEEVKRVLYPVLRASLQGKSKQEAADRLLNFVQTAFQYQTDQQQFGRERSLFPDEMFFYPYSDCEDRSILYATLVRDLLDLDVVLLLYPNHMATAVRFSEKVTGDYLMVDGRRYVVSDPTYVGARVGCAMPDFKHASAQIFRVD